MKKQKQDITESYKKNTEKTTKNELHKMKIWNKNNTQM